MSRRKTSILNRLRQVYRQWRNDDGNLLAAAVAYYAALSFFPLLLVLISGLGLFLQWTAWGQDAQAEVLDAIGNYASPAVQANVQQMLNQVQRQATVNGPLGIVLLTVSAAALFAQFDRAFDRIWNLDRRNFKGLPTALLRIAMFRLRAFLMLAALLALILIVFLAGIALSSVKTYAADILPRNDWIWWAIQSGASVILNWGLFTTLYVVLPKVHVRWAAAAQGGLLAAIAWEAGRLVLNSLVVSRKYSAYGIVGSFIAVMVWFYFASAVIFVGAEYIQVIGEDAGQRHSGSSGDAGSRQNDLRSP
jgi:membrane protein